MHLARLGRKNEAFRALRKLAEALRASPPESEPWDFYEYFNRRTGDPMGTRDQSWNSAAFLFGYHTAVEDSPPGFARPELQRERSPF
jgi:hypothetical protein